MSDIYEPVTALYATLQQSLQKKANDEAMRIVALDQKIHNRKASIAELEVHLANKTQPRWLNKQKMPMVPDPAKETFLTTWDSIQADVASKTVQAVLAARKVDLVQLQEQAERSFPEHMIGIKTYLESLQPALENLQGAIPGLLAMYEKDFKRWKKTKLDTARLRRLEQERAKQEKKNEFERQKALREIDATMVNPETKKMQDELKTLQKEVKALKANTGPKKKAKDTPKESGSSKKKASKNKAAKPQQRSGGGGESSASAEGNKKKNQGSKKTQKKKPPTKGGGSGSGKGRGKRA